MDCQAKYEKIIFQARKELEEKRKEKTEQEFQKENLAFETFKEAAEILRDIQMTTKNSKVLNLLEEYLA